MRDIENYSKNYVINGFEEYKVLYRRKKIIEIIEKYQPKRILEIGCGMEPLFKYVENVEFTIVEPSQIFLDNALSLIHEGMHNIHLIQGFFEEVVSKGISKDYDLVICSSLLHEVEDPSKLIKAIAQICDTDTIVHINVPNANSIHRLLGQEMRILTDVHDKSENNIMFQQNNVFDKYKLENIVNNNGLEVIESGSFFIKPFSHSQMYQMMQKEIIDQKVLDGLYALGKYMPEFGSEIYVNCKIRK